MTKEELNHCLKLCYQWRKNSPDGESAHNELQIVALELLRDENINIDKFTADILLCFIDGVLDEFRDEVRLIEQYYDDD